MAFAVLRRQLLVGGGLGLLAGCAMAQDFGRLLTLPGSTSAGVSTGVGVAVPAAQPVAGGWSLRKGALVHEELRGWARSAGWEFRWYPVVTWSVAADTAFAGDFPEAISRVVEALHREGQPVRLVLWDGNKVAEVVSNDVR